MWSVVDQRMDDDDDDDWERDDDAARWSPSRSDTIEALLAAMNVKVTEWQRDVMDWLFNDAP
jgi:hypothetical protein